MRRVFSILLKVLLSLVLLLVLAVVGALVALRIPSVQTRLAHEATTMLTRKLGQQVVIERVDVRPFSRVLLDGVRVLDRAGGELFSIGRADADIALFSIFDPSHLHIGKLTLEEPRFELKNLAGQPDSTTLDQFISSVKRLMGPSTDTTRSSFDFKIKDVSIRNGHFAIEEVGDPLEPYYGRSIDYDHMVADSIYADITNLHIGDTLSAHLDHLHAVETPSQTQLREITADIQYHEHFWEFKDLNLRVGRSQVKDYVRFEYRTFSNFTDYNDSMKTIARLRGSRVYSDDIAKFAPQLKDLHETVLISGDAEGYVRDFKVNNLDVRYGTGTHIVAKHAYADGLPDYRKTLIDLRLLPSVVETRDLRHWLPASANEVVSKLGRVKLQGQVMGFYSDFVANASFETALGNVTTDVNLKTKTDLTHAAYSGTVRSNNFQLGKFLGDESIIRDVTLNGRVNGVGFLPPDARGNANVTAQRIWLNGYRYQNVSFNGAFDYNDFQGKVSINDPNVRLSADGHVNLSRAHQLVDLRATIAKADLYALKLTKQHFTLATTANVQLKGVELDSLTGYAFLRKSRFTLDGRTLSLDTLDVTSTRNHRNERRVTVRSEAVDASVSGIFNTSDVVRDVRTLITEYELNFESNDAATAEYYRKKLQRPLPVYQVDLQLNLKRANPVLALFVPDLRISDNSKLDGSFRNGETSIFQFGGHLDSLNYDNIQTIDNEIDFLTSKLPYKPEILAQASVTSARQVLPGLGRTEKFVVEGVWDQNHINFSTSLAQTGTTNRATINGELAFLPRMVEIVFQRSTVNLLDKEWTIAADNSVRISDYGREFDVTNLTFSNGKQFVGAQGFISGDATKPPLELTVKDFELANINSLTGQHLSGRVNAQGTVAGVYGPLMINSTLSVDSLTYDGTLIGQVAGRGDWDNRAGKLLLNLDVARNGQSVLTVLGDLAPNDPVNQFNITGKLNDAPIVLAQPFLGSLFSNLGGTGRGELRLTGKFASPNLVGGIDVSNGRLTFDYLKTTYTFADRIDFTMTSIDFRNVKLRDALGNSGTVDGIIRHQGFNDMSLDLAANFRKLQVLNTTRRDNDLYFGTAYATGTARVTGPTDDLSVVVRASSEAGTRLSLPFDNAAKAEKAGYIKFVNNNTADTVVRKKAIPLAAQDKVDLSGIRLDMNLTVTPEAYLEILLDESTGDVIRGSAAGQLRMSIDTRGEFNMYGQVEIVRGAYNFTLQGLVNKEFVVRPGGIITWNGDPLAGEMNVTATYTQRTSLAPVIYGSTTSSGNGAVVPVTAVMTLTGPLLLPTIKLGLEFNDAPGTLQGDLAAFTTAIRNDEQELNRQVFSLLVFKQLSPLGSFNQISIRGQDNTVGNSLGQILSTQLGLLTSQIDQNLEIDFNLNGLSAEQLQALQVRLSYSFLNGRLRVTREGGFTNNNTLNNNSNGTPITGTNTNNQNALVGDLSLEYFLRADGKFRVKLRYETTPRDLQIVNQPRAGISLLHTEQFNTFGELFSRKNPKRRERNTLKARESGKERLTVDEDPRTPL